eukprot:TRINITY_DN6007_c0_g1_i1.p1 TRINITY_DN6007_c0_g1~~TRINITY_DN6007_c0_g1_i1.p1  ORF type:complete len:622 (+),score=238.41 TRINITY_DN6007_c0_g1_i1:63-1928(+)
MEEGESGTAPATPVVSSPANAALTDMLDSSAEEEVGSTSGDSGEECQGKKSLLTDSGDNIGEEDDLGFVEYKWKLVNVPPNRLEHLITQMKFRVAEGQGECMYEIGVSDDGTTKGLVESEYTESLDTVRKMAARLNCDVSIVCEKVVAREPQVLTCAELLVRRMHSQAHSLDLRIAICGNVDSGKSTLAGVLTTGELDNGRGSTRQSVFVHRHEIETGRTSAISQQLIGFDSTGHVVNHGAGMHHALSPQEIVERSSKVVTLFDLAGHEKYLKTTVFGMTGCAPDYAALVLSANNGIQRMTKEHLGLSLALKMPVFTVITRIDACPEAVYKNTLSDVKKMLKMPGVRKLPMMVRTDEDVVVCAKNIPDDRIVPVFAVSNVTGEGLGLLRKFLNLLPLRKEYHKFDQAPLECYVENTFFVQGVGAIVSGMITRGSVSVNDTVQLGPDKCGNFRSVQVKSIHVRNLPTKTAAAGVTASFALKKEKRNLIRKGMVLLGKDHPTVCCYEFEADVVVLYHTTMIQTNYQPVVHCRTVRQSANISLASEQQLRTGDKAKVRFRFLYHPEFLSVGAKIVFREGRTKGLGTITSVTPYCPAIGKQPGKREKQWPTAKHKDPAVPVATGA